MNRDPDYAIRLEKAIAEKYGEKTVLNPHSQWTPEKEKKYLKELKDIHTSEDLLEKEKEEHNGFLVSEKLINLSKKKYCNTCDTYRPELYNRMYFIKFDCCKKCFIQFIESREERWHKGWRPKGETKKCR